MKEVGLGLRQYEVRSFTTNEYGCRLSNVTVMLVRVFYYRSTYGKIRWVQTSAAALVAERRDGRAADEAHGDARRRQARRHVRQGGPPLRRGQVRGWSLATIGAAPTWHPWVAHRTSRRLVPSNGSPPRGGAVLETSRYGTLPPAGQRTEAYQMDRRVGSCREAVGVDTERAPGAPSSSFSTASTKEGAAFYIRSH